jgi:hypothetical protein
VHRKRSGPHTFYERLAAEKMRLEELLKNATREEQREQIRRKLRQIEMAFQMDRWMGIG